MHDEYSLQKSQISKSLEGWVSRFTHSPASEELETKSPESAFNAQKVRRSLVS